jgi:hypothetical protein
MIEPRLWLDLVILAGVAGCEVPGIVITEEDQELSQIRIRNERIN